MSTNTNKKGNFGVFLRRSSVPLMFILICAVCIPLSGLSPSYLINEIVTRMGRNAFLILALLIPIMAGMGLNFGMTLGAMALTTDRTDRKAAGITLDNCTHIPAPYMFPELDTIKYMQTLLDDDHSGAEKPAALLISSSKADGVVGGSPDSYRTILDGNGEEYLSHILTSTGHDHTSVRPHLYNYFRIIFR